MKARTFRRPVLSVTSGILLLAVSVSALAAMSGVTKFKGQYKIKADIMVDGKLVSSPRFVVLPNEPASLETKAENPPSALRMMLTASDYSSAQVTDGIDLKMALEYQTPERSYRANPRVVVAPGEEGTVQIVSDSGGSLEMVIKAERQ